MAKPTSTDRALRVLIALKGHTMEGLANVELAHGLGESAVNISRALAVLERNGLVRKLDTGRWAHSITMLQIAQAHANHMADTQDRLLEINRRVAAGAAR